MAAEKQKIFFGERPAGFEPLEIILPRLVGEERPEYRELLSEFQAKATELLVKYRVYQNLGLLPIEEEFFYGQFLKVLVTRPKAFDMRRLNLASWIQEKGMEYFQRYCLGLGINPQLPAPFRWHYLFFDRVGEVADVLDDESLSPGEKEEGLRAIGQDSRISEVRQAAERLVSRRLGGDIARSI